MYPPTSLSLVLLVPKIITQVPTNPLLIPIKKANESENHDASYKQGILQIGRAKITIITSRILRTARYLRATADGLKINEGINLPIQSQELQNPTTNTDFQGSSRLKNFN